jgi:hypothetical protein
MFGGDIREKLLDTLEAWLRQQERPDASPP